MDAQLLWIVVLSLATPIAGVVGFAIQIRNVKKTRLENEKLQLEIAALRLKAEQLDSRIVRATNEEVLRISHPDIPMYSRGGLAARGDMDVTPPPSTSVKEHLVVAAVLTLVALVVVYALYDIYRLIKWLLQ